MNTKQTPRVLRTGASVGRTLYDAESGALVGLVDTPELAEHIARCVWRETSAQALGEGETPIRPAVSDWLSSLYDPAHVQERHAAERADATADREATAMLDRERAVAEPEPVELAADPLTAAHAFLMQPQGDRSDRDVLMQAIDVLNALVACIEPKQPGMRPDAADGETSAAEPPSPAERARYVKYLAQRLDEQRREFDEAVDRLARGEL